MKCVVFGTNFHFFFSSSSRNSNFKIETKCEENEIAHLFVAFMMRSEWKKNMKELIRVYCLCGFEFSHFNFIVHQNVDFFRRKLFFFILCDLLPLNANTHTHNIIMAIRN